jgi:ADP-ribosylglycohydrolase
MHAAGVGIAALRARDAVDGAEFLLTVGAETQMREYRSRYESAARMVARELDPVRVVDVLGNGRSALGSVVTAAYCFARHPDDFERAIATALALGGNASSIAAMTGAISGARLGLSEIPARWVERVESDGLSVAKMRELAGGLAAAAKRL